jgi:hypothetical protein
MRGVALQQRKVNAQRGEGTLHLVRCVRDEIPDHLYRRLEPHEQFAHRSNRGMNLVWNMLEIEAFQARACRELALVYFAPQVHQRSKSAPDREPAERCGCHDDADFQRGQRKQQFTSCR